MLVVDTLPAVELRIGGASIDDALMGQLIELEVLQRVNSPASCELRFSDPSGRALDAFSKGASLSVNVGEQQRCIFDGSVAAVEFESRGHDVRTVRVLGYDALEALRRGSPVRVHSDVTFADLAREFTQSLGVTVDFEEPGPLYPRLVQHRRADFDILLEVAERVGVFIWLDQHSLRSCRPTPDAECATKEVGTDLREVKIVVSDAASASSVDVRGWDPHLVHERHGKARSSSTSTGVTITNVVLRSDREAENFARSQVERRSASGAVLQAILEGDPSIGPGVCFKIKDLPDGYGGPFRITSARHAFSPALGYVVEVSSSLPPPHAPREGATALLGLVSDVRDPEHLGRVKVRYPGVADAESDWLQVLAAGAGGKKGLVALPAENDRVLVLSVNDDPAHGIVIGALYGQDGLPGERTKPFSGYAFFSPGGHVVELDDNGSLTLRTPGGSFLELGRERSTLHSATDVLIEAPGKTIAIGAAQVEIKKS